MNNNIFNKELRYLLTQNCNYDCVFCNHEGLYNKTSTLLTSDDYIYLYTVCKNKFGWKSITLTGGEPLVYKDFDKIVEGIAKQHGKITIVSNGELLDKHLSSIDLLKRVNLSLHSLDDKNYEQLVRRKGTLPKVIENIKTVRKASPHVDIRLNVVLTKGINSSLDDVTKIVEFADLNGCSINFIELSNDKDRMVSQDEVKAMLKQIGFAEQEQDSGKKKIKMGDSIILTRCLCETAQALGKPSKMCNEISNFCITPSGSVNLCVVTNEQESILKEIKERKDDQLVKKLSKINIRFGKNCIYDKEV